jgi:RES domain-containing protein
VVTRSHTGRAIPVGADYDLAKEWADVGDRRTLLSHGAAGRFGEELKSAPAAAGNDLICFRGRLDDSTITSWQNMGPPPSSNKGGRYNPPGVVALYLCDSPDGVLRELAPQPGLKVFLQEYRLSPTSLRLADFSSVHLTDFVKAVFDMAENSCVVGRVGPSSYELCRVVGELVREANFEGMVVPGVRGTQSFQYRNIVAFDAHDQWRIWSRQDAGFRYVIAANAAV